MSRDDYEFELTATRSEAAAVLTDVADGVLAGSVLLGDGPDAVAVDAPEEMDVEVEFESDDEGVSLEVELEWPHPEEGSAVAPADPSATDGDHPADAPAAEDGEESDDETGETHGPETPVGAADASQSLARFELFRDRRDEWRWRLRHRNGNIIASSGEGYTRKHNAQKGLRSVVQNAPGASVTEDTE